MPELPEPEPNTEPNTESHPRTDPIPIDTLKSQLPQPPGPAPRPAELSDTLAPASPKPRKPRSPKQIEASRRNGAKSRGPASLTGKVASSRNRTTHGLRAARNPYLPSWEDSAGFQRHLEEYLKTYLPQDRAQYEYVHDIALNDWQRRHFYTLHARTIEILAANREPGVDPDTAVAHSLFQFVPPSLPLYLATIRRLDIARSRFQRDCFALQDRLARAGSQHKKLTFEPEPVFQPVENQPLDSTDKSGITFEPEPDPSPGSHSPSSEPLTNNREPADA